MTYNPEYYYLDVATDINFTSFVSGYENKIVTGTAHEVTGLEPNTPYYYRIRAKLPYNTTPSSNIISTTTENDVLTVLYEADNDYVISLDMTDGSGTTVSNAHPTNIDATFFNTPTWIDNGNGTYNIGIATNTALQLIDNSQYQATTKLTHTVIWKNTINAATRYFYIKENNSPNTDKEFRWFIDASNVLHVYLWDGGTVDTYPHIIYWYSSSALPISLNSEQALSFCIDLDANTIVVVLNQSDIAMTNYINLGSGYVAPTWLPAFPNKTMNAYIGNAILSNGSTVVNQPIGELKNYGIMISGKTNTELKAIHEVMGY